MKSNAEYILVRGGREIGGGRDEGGKREREKERPCFAPGNVIDLQYALGRALVHLGDARNVVR